jgi:hypothetical protein
MVPNISFAIIKANWSSTGTEAAHVLEWIATGVVIGVIARDVITPGEWASISSTLSPYSSCLTLKTPAFDMPYVNYGLESGGNTVTNITNTILNGLSRVAPTYRIILRLVNPPVIRLHKPGNSMTKIKIMLKSEENANIEKYSFG